MIYLAFSFCDLALWHVALAWLLPFLLGLLLGYAIWAKYKKIKEELEEEVKGLKDKIKGLEDDLIACKHHGTELDSEISLLKGQLREKVYAITTLEASLDAANKKGGSKTESGGIKGAIVGAVKSIVTSGKKKDDLKKVEGIGPKIEELLNSDGISTFSDLASSNTSRLQKILDNAGSRYKISNPDSWAEQAALARDGKWDELEKLQGSLKGGKKE